MSETTPAKQSASLTQTRSQRLLLALAYLGFISLGLPDTIAGVAWPSVRESFALSQSHFGLVFIALGCGYCSASFFGGTLMLRLGVGTLLAISSLLVVVAMFGFALAPAWPLFFACAVIWGLGSGAIDSALNSYASTNFSTRHMNWLHACYSVGATLGPLLMTAMLVYFRSWRLGYALVGTVLLIMSGLFLVTRHRWRDPSRVQHGDADAPGTIGATLREPLVWFSVIAFFLYTGLEFTVGQWSFTLLTESRGVRADLAGVLAGAYFGAIGVGRVAFGAVADRVGVDRLIRFSMGTALAGTILFAIGTPIEVGFAGLIITGLGLAPVFPCLMARTPLRLGPAIATHAIGFQVGAAMLGVAMIPGLAGIAAQTMGLEIITWTAVLLAALMCATHELLLYFGRNRSVPPTGAASSRTAADA
jgi:fucose permease